MSEKLGMEAELAYKVGGVGGGGSFVVLTNVKDVTLNLDRGETDVTTRGNLGWRAKRGTLKEGSVEFEMQWDTDDPGFAAMQTAWDTGAAIGLRILDGPDGTGLVADFSIIGFTRSEPLEEAITVSIKASITRSETPPEWVNGD